MQALPLQRKDLSFEHANKRSAQLSSDAKYKSCLDVTSCYAGPPPDQAKAMVRCCTSHVVRHVDGRKPKWLDEHLRIYESVLKSNAAQQI